MAKGRNGVLPRFVFYIFAAFSGPVRWKDQRIIRLIRCEMCADQAQVQVPLAIY